MPAHQDRNIPCLQRFATQSGPARLEQGGDVTGHLRGRFDAGIPTRMLPKVPSFLSEALPSWACSLQNWRGTGSAPSRSRGSSSARGEGSTAWYSMPGCRKASARFPKRRFTASTSRLPERQLVPSE